MPDVSMDRLKKTILYRYLSVTTAVIFSCFAILGTFLLVYVSDFWEKDKKQVMMQSATAASAYIAVLASVNENSGTVNLDPQGYLLGTMQTFKAFNGSDFFITDPLGNIITSSCAFAQANADTPKVPDEILVAVFEQEQFSGSGTLDGLFSTQQYFVAIPVTYTSASGDTAILGVLFTATDAENLGQFRQRFIQIFLIAAILGSLVSFCAIWMLTYRMVQPLREMSAAARRYGNGDFSRRIPVRSEDEIGQLAVALNNMASSLSVAENMRRSFIANVSHELKTPMTTIAGFIDGILDGTIPADKRSNYLHIVSDEVKRLSRLVRSMLDLTRIDSGEMTLSRSDFELSAILLNTALLFEQKIDEKSLDIQGLDLLTPVYVNGDHDLIHQVVYNLMENAAKFTPIGGFIRFQCAEKDSRAYVAISNSCEGLAPEELPLIFDRFYKTDHSRSQDKNGIGLGLYLAKTIVRLHGGEISAKVTSQSEVTFTFWLPKAREFRAKERAKRQRADTEKNGGEKGAPEIETPDKNSP